jgi:uncharacterized membrane protein SpoIIM required for sporulation
MRETKFIEQNKKKWDSLEKILKEEKKDPDKLSDLFIQLTDDLSYARTFYPNRSVRVYLNNKAQQIFFSIYKNKSQKRGKFISFWTEELPSLVYHSRKELLISLVIFILSGLIGLISSVHDPDFCRVILGDEYVEMTLTNIQGGDPMAVYKKMNKMDMFLGISLNNLLVAVRTFILGFFFAIGTVAILLYNGIMVSTFQYFFIERGLFWESFLTIWLHGTLEIGAIIIAGGSGLVLGKGLIFPGSYRRLQAFQISAKKGLKLLLGIVPIIIFAAMIESFVTRYTDVPDYLKLGIILASLLFMISYFLYLPLYKKRNGSLKTKTYAFPVSNKKDLSYEGKVKSNTEIFKDAFSFQGIYFKTLLTVNLILCLLYVPVAVWYLYPDFVPGLTVDVWIKLNFPQIFKYSHHPYMFVLNTLVFAINLHLTYSWLFRNRKGDSSSGKNLLKWKSLKPGIWKSLVFSALIQTVFFISTGWAFILFLIICPYLLLTLFISQIEESSNHPFSKSIALLSGCKARILGLTSLIVFLGLLTYFLIESPLIMFYYQVLQWNLVMDNFFLEVFYYVFNISVTLICLNILFSMLAYSIGMLYFTLKEINEAISLKARIKNMPV